jgi:hypothetical protein
MPQSNAVKDGVLASETTVNLQWANALKVFLGEFWRYVDLRLEYRDVVTVLDDQKIPCDLVDYRI